VESDSCQVYANTGSHLQIGKYWSLTIIAEPTEYPTTPTRTLTTRLMGGVFSTDQEPDMKLVPNQWSQNPQPLGVIALLPTIPQLQIFRKEPVNPSLSWCLIRKFRQEKGSSFYLRIVWHKESANSLSLCYVPQRPIYNLPPLETEIGIPMTSPTCQ